MNGWKSVGVVTVVCAVTSLSAFASSVSPTCNVTETDVKTVSSAPEVIDSIIDGALLQSESVGEDSILAPQAEPARESADTAHSESTSAASESVSDRSAATVAIPLPPALQAGGATLVGVIGAVGASHVRRRRSLRRRGAGE